MDTPEPVTNESSTPLIAKSAESVEKVETLEDEALDGYECRACGYVYDPAKGDNTGNIAANTAFADLPPNWRCPVCSARKKAFTNIGPVNAASGFKENLGYGFGVNTLTPGQKNILIFGSLLAGLIMMLSFYGLG